MNLVDGAGAEDTVDMRGAQGVQIGDRQTGRGEIGEMAPAVHRAIVCVDVEGFAARRRTNAHQVAIRDGLYGALQRAFAKSGVCWQDCYHEDRGDGVLVLVPPEVPKTLLVTGIAGKLAAALAEHNRAHGREARIRLRMAVHAGEICYDHHGVAGAAINLACRLLEAEALKRALSGSMGVLAVIASRWFFEEVIRHDPATGPASYRRVRVSVKETEDDAWICLPDDPYPPKADAWLPSAPAVAVPRQRPGAVSGFAGRAAQLRTLSRLLEKAAGAGGTVVISAIGGTAGIGKTALAVTWAHQVAGQFPNGQLYVNLRGFDPAGVPVTSAEAVRGFLDAFEVPAEKIPVSLDAQAALYRSLLAGRRVLVVLDNARDAAQVRPLLPGAPGCVVVITSRNQLTSLISAEAAHSLTLDLLTPAEARQLLSRRLGASRVGAEPQAAGEIITLCARLPLALAIVAARAATHPGFALAALARELRDTRGSLEAFHGGEAAADARAVFSWSYQQLSAGAARLFRLAGLHPGPHVTTPAAASLAGAPERLARLWLAELARAHLLAEETPGRFTFHDLLRAYASEQAHAHEPPQEQLAALREFADFAAAWAWFEAEYTVLLAVIEFAAATGFGMHAWQLAWTMLEYFERQGHWHDCAASHHTALAAAGRHLDHGGQARAHFGIGVACRLLGQTGDARTHLRQALLLFEEISDQIGQAQTHLNLSETCDRIQDALAHCQQALALCRAAGHRRGQAYALNNLGWYHALLGDPHQALAPCQQALALQRELGDRGDEAGTLDSIGYIYYQLGNHQRATACLEQALALAREIGDRYVETFALTHLGDTHYAAGNLGAARVAWQQVLPILDGFGLAPGVEISKGAASADQIRAKLASV